MLGDVVEPVRVRIGEVRDRARQHQADHREPCEEAPLHAFSSNFCGTPRSRYTRSGRAEATAVTVTAVITPSPMPISTCTPSTAAATVPNATPPWPPIAYSSTKPNDARTVFTSAHTNATAARPPLLRVASFRRATAVR